MMVEIRDYITVAGKSIIVTHDDGISEEEVREAAHRALTRGYESVRVTVDGYELLLEYRVPPVPFERIRRITGYLVGTIDRWNDGKTAEEADRVKHQATASTSRSC